MATQLWAT